MLCYIHPSTLVNTPYYRQIDIKSTLEGLWFDANDSQLERTELVS